MAEARATWTDERLDDLSRRVEDGFRRVDSRFDSLEARMDARFEAQNAELSRRIDAQGSRIDSLQRTMIQVGAAQTVAIIGTLVTVVLTRA